MSQGAGSACLPADSGAASVERVLPSPFVIISFNLKIWPSLSSPKAAASSDLAAPLVHHGPPSQRRGQARPAGDPGWIARVLPAEADTPYFPEV